MKIINLTRRSNILVMAWFTLLVTNCWSQQAAGSALPAPSGRVILTISGAISNVNAAGAAQFDAIMIEALPRHSIKTNTPWYKQSMTFTGPRLSDVLAAVGATGTVLEIKALNDYKVDVPLNDALQYQPILARQMDGKVLSIRDKGPLFLVYPFDARQELKNDIYYGRSIWQISSITVR
ncbi:MAG: hypothetical protein RLZZ591_1658 [Pseudomonadota bacterium]|jgi:hypothetical protein